MIRHSKAHLKLGLRGELCAARYLENLGYEILGHDIHFEHAQADLAARDGRSFVIVEVKTLRFRKGADNQPEFNLSPAQKERLRKAGREMMHRFKDPPFPLRFDLVEVVEGAFRIPVSIRLHRGFFAVDDRKKRKITEP